LKFAISRTLKNRVLSFLAASSSGSAIATVYQQYQTANNMTDEFAALQILANSDVPERRIALDNFYQKWKDEPLVVNKWIGVQSGSKLPGTLQDIQQLETHPAFDAFNANKIRALYRVFANNHIHFHDSSGAGYRYFADKIIEIDGFNSLVASGLAKSFLRFSKLDDVRSEHMRKEIERVLQCPATSNGVAEILGNILASGKSN